MEGEEHRRIKKALSPAFSNTALRGYLDTFNLSFEKVWFHPLSVWAIAHADA